jgi:drug/metabolite transporter (DMT)-like permease
MGPASDTSSIMTGSGKSLSGRKPSLGDHRPPALRLYSLIILMIVFWSANFAVGKHVIRNIPPLLTVGMRTAIAAAAMIVVYRIWARRTGNGGWHSSDLPLLLGLGLLGIGVNQLCFVLGIARTSVSHAAIMIGLTPMLVLIIAWLMGQERMSRGRFIGMAVALGGVAVLQTGSSRGRASSWTGDGFILLAALAFAWFTVRGKAEIHRLGGVTVNMFGYVCSAVAMLPVTVSFAMEFDFARVTWGVWASLLYMALFPSVACYLIYYYALKHIPASRLAAFAFLQPLFATLIAIPTVGEYPTGSLLAGGALVLAGVFATERF